MSSVAAAVIAEILPGVVHARAARAVVGPAGLNDRAARSWAHWRPGWRRGRRRRGYWWPGWWWGHRWWGHRRPGWRHWRRGRRHRRRSRRPLGHWHRRWRVAAAAATAAAAEAPSATSRTTTLLATCEAVPGPASRPTIAALSPLPLHLKADKLVLGRARRSLAAAFRKNNGGPGRLAPKRPIGALQNMGRHERCVVLDTRFRVRHH